MSKRMVLLLAVLLPSVVQAWDAAEVIQGLVHERADAARFTEIKYLKALEHPIRLDGEVRFIPPDGMEKYVTAPYEERMTVSNGWLRLQRGEKIRELELERHPVAQAFVTAFTATLMGDAATLQQHYEMKLDGNERAWQLSLTPRESDLLDKVSLIKVSGSGKVLQSFETLQPKGDRAIMYFSALPHAITKPEREPGGEPGGNPASEQGSE